MTNFQEIAEKNQQLCPQGNFYDEMDDNFYCYELCSGKTMATQMNTSL